MIVPVEELSTGRRSYFRLMKRTILLLLLPPLLISALYLLFLGHRTDYVGHFMAGYGGTLLVIAAMLEILRDAKRPPAVPLVITVALFICIGIGALEEATTFRLAKFDEIDFFNQSLGAVLGALILLQIHPSERADSRSALPSIGTAVLFLLLGFIYAFR